LLIPADFALAAEPAVSPEMLAGVTVALPHPGNCPPLYGGFIELLENVGGNAQYIPDHNAYSLDQYCRRNRVITLTPGQFIDEPMVDIVSRYVEGFDPCCELVLLSRPGDQAPALRSLLAFARTLGLTGQRGVRIGNGLS
jgi:hypothetical protein